MNGMQSEILWRSQVLSGFTAVGSGKGDKWWVFGVIDRGWQRLGQWQQGQESIFSPQRQCKTLGWGNVCPIGANILTSIRSTGSLIDALGIHHPRRITVDSFIDFSNMHDQESVCFTLDKEISQINSKKAAMVLISKSSMICSSRSSLFKFTKAATWLESWMIVLGKESVHHGLSVLWREHTQGQLKLNYNHNIAIIESAG